MTLQVSDPFFIVLDSLLVEGDLTPDQETGSSGGDGSSYEES